MQITTTFTMTAATTAYERERELIIVLSIPMHEMVLGLTCHLVDNIDFNLSDIQKLCRLKAKYIVTIVIHCAATQSKQKIPIKNMKEVTAGSNGYHYQYHSPLLGTAVILLLLLLSSHKPRLI